MSYSVIQGKNRMLMIRLFQGKDVAPIEDAVLVPFGKSHEWSQEVSSDEETTKTGSITTSGTFTDKLSWETTAVRPDSEDATDLDKMLYYAMEKGQEVEIWDVDFGATPKEAENGSKLYPSKYATMLITSGTQSFGDGSGTVKYEGSSSNVAFHDATVSSKNDEIQKRFFYDTLKASQKVTEKLEVYEPKK